MTDENAFAVTDWQNYVGQKQLKSRLMVHAQAALASGRMLDDMLFVAPPGAGKTTLARLLAAQMHDPFEVRMMPTDPQQFCQFCKRWEGGVILLDEIHSAPKKFWELLYSAVGQPNKMLYPPSGRPIDVNHITFLGATTEPERLPKPLWDRFKVKPRWDDYSEEDLELIIANAAVSARVDLPAGLAHELARAAGGTPRLAGALVGACRDLQMTGMPLTVETVLDLVGVDRDGLSDRHIDYLKALDTLNGSSGLKNISTMMQLAPAAVEDLERLLLQQGMVTLERTGRQLTDAGAAKLPNRRRRLSPSERRAS